MGRCKRRTLRKIISDLDPTFENTISKVHSALDLTQIAEEQIDMYCRKYPDDKRYLWPAFKILRPTDQFLGKDHKIYRYHCKELLIRILNGASTKLATKAEAMLALSEMSLIAPLKQDHAALYQDLFVGIMGRTKIDFSGVAQYSHSKAVEELLSKMQKKLRQEWRK